MELGTWQVHLDKHFQSLREDRSAVAPGHPIFALEHGLDADERNDLSEAVREHILHGPPAWGHRLPWIVYATEIGYDYAGDQYWHTFETETPGWKLRGNRRWLRNCFRWFQEQFDAAKPSGRWADHFSIICWPITHAVLPRDLQRQLASVLFSLRNSFSEQLLKSPEMFGALIAARSWNATSRFRNLAEDKLLVGQIAAALLLQGECGTARLVHLAALHRIGEDLDRERQARGWLHSARRFVRERKSVRGLELCPGQQAAIEPRSEPSPIETSELGVDPRLILRPTGLQGISWDVVLEIPDLSSLLLKFPSLQDVLTNSRCFIAGSSGRPLARGRFFHGSQTVTLFNWPQSDEVLLRFERATPQLDYLLRTECLLRPGPTWLFRIASDGLAYESRTLCVRPGERYVVISASRPVHSRAIPVTITCEGVKGGIIEPPSAITQDWEEALRDLGLSQAKTIEVWPAGLASLVWDGEGHGEWLASEQPCLAIRSDYPIDGLGISMAGRPDLSLEVAPISPGEICFVELPKLPIGVHTLQFRAIQRPLAESELLGNLNVTMRIRDAQPWSSDVITGGPLSIQVDPASPTLEQLWEGRVEIELHGPAGRQVDCNVILINRDGPGPAMSQRLPPIHLPVTPADWRWHFDRHFRKLPQAQNSYDVSWACEIEFSAHEFGACRIRCEREFKPIRWAVRRDGAKYDALLFDDTEDSRPLLVSHYAFESPAVEERLEPSSLYQVPPLGGLYLARGKDFATSVIVPPSVHGHDFTGFGFSPHFKECDRSPEDIVSLLGLSVLWTQANVSGNPLSSMRQYQVLTAVVRRIFVLFAGDSWETAELAALEGGEGLLVLQRSVASQRDEAHLAKVLAGECASLATKRCNDRVLRLSVLARHFLSVKSVDWGETDSELSGRGCQASHSSDGLDWLCELALRLASDPAGVESWAGKGLSRGIAQLLDQLALSKAARFLVIAIHCYLQAKKKTGQLYAGWEWT